MDKKLEQQDPILEDSVLSSEEPKKKRKDRRVEREYTDLIEVTDPVTGQMIKQTVKITRFKSKGEGFQRKKFVVSQEELELEETEDSED